MYFILKTLITALVVARVSELAKRRSPIAAILASAIMFVGYTIYIALMRKVGFNI